MLILVWNITPTLCLQIAFISIYIGGLYISSVISILAWNITSAYVYKIYRTCCALSEYSCHKNVKFKTKHRKCRKIKYFFKLLNAITLNSINFKQLLWAIESCEIDFF